MRISLLLVALGMPLLIAGRCEEVDRSMQASLDGGEDRLSGLVEVGEGAASAVIPLIPGSTGWVAAIAWAVLASLRAHHNRRRARRIVEALESVKADNVVDFNDEHTRRELDRLMGHSGKRLVDEAQGRAVSIPI